MKTIKIHIKRNNPKHSCALPGALRRWFHGLGVGSVIECEECGATYALVRRHSCYDGPYNTWERF